MKKFLISLPILALIACAGTETSVDTSPDAQIAQTETTSLNAESDSPKQADAAVQNAPQQAVDAGTLAKEAYKQAYELYRKNKYTEGVAKFEEFISKWPASDLADNAQYWIGECYYSMHDWQKAITAFQKVLSSYPTGNKLPDATLKIGYTYRELARENFNAVIKQYPRSNSARLAKRRLAN